MKMKEQQSIKEDDVGADKNIFKDGEVDEDDDHEDEEVDEDDDHEDEDDEEVDEEYSPEDEDDETWFEEDYTYGSCIIPSGKAKPSSSTTQQTSRPITAAELNVIVGSDWAEKAIAAALTPPDYAHAVARLVDGPATVENQRTVRDIDDTRLRGADPAFGTPSARAQVPGSTVLAIEPDGTSSLSNASDGYIQKLRADVKDPETPATYSSRNTDVLHFAMSTTNAMHVSDASDATCFTGGRQIGLHSSVWAGLAAEKGITFTQTMYDLLTFTYRADACRRTVTLEGTPAQMNAGLLFWNEETNPLLAPDRIITFRSVKAFNTAKDYIPMLQDLGGGVSVRLKCVCACVCV